MKKTYLNLLIIIDCV